MLCTKCPSPAQVDLRRHHAAFCGEHYLEFFQDHVQRNIRAHGMFGRADKVLVAVSGGKDSLGLWDVLLRLGYAVSGVYVDLGITEYSTRSRDKCVLFAQAHDAELIIKDVRQLYGGGVAGITELGKTLKRPPCSGCGVTKRYVTNQVAYEMGFPVLATGHNLDDESATLLGNVLHWQAAYLARQSPVLESTHPGLARKVKPLFTFSEKETLSYVLLRGIDYIEEECPNAHGASSLAYKAVLNELERQSPGTKASFLNGFLEQARGKFTADDTAEVGVCRRCGEPTTTDICAFCRMWERARAQNPASHGQQGSAG